MKRCFILLQERHIKNCLEKVQQLGILHIDQQRYESEKVAGLHQELTNVKTILQRLKLLAPKQTYQAVSNYDVAKVENLERELSAIISEERLNNEEIRSLQDRVSDWSAWGEFDPALIRKLKNNGIEIHLFSVSEHHLADLLASPIEYFVINRESDKTLVAVIDRGLVSDGEKQELFARLPLELELPECSGAEAREHIEKLEQRNAGIEKTLRDRLYEQNVLHAYSEDLADRLEFEKAYNSLEDAGDGISLLSGYVPEESANDLKLLAKNYSFGLVLRDVDAAADDQAPTKLKQSFISRLINPIMSFLEVTPAYHEPDISFSFFSFFTVFVAMIMSDAVYGLVILLLGLIVQIAAKKFNTLVQMLYVLGLATFIWGVASGSWFGSRTIADMELFKNYSVWQLSIYPDLFQRSVKEQQSFVMWLCFSLGALHLIVAHLWRMVRELKRVELKALTNLGMVAMINGLYWVLLWMVRITGEIPVHALPSLLGGLGLVICFGQQEHGVNFFTGILRGFKGLFTTFLDTVGLFGDIMSYIRLFAVGIASFSIASSFNSMGQGIIGSGNGSLGILLLLAGILVLVVGHAINFVLGCLSVIVHAVRLNMLEFSNHIGLEWSGYKYRPFIKRRIK
ncbi:hypothetical protein P0082_11395 [Candidatus Haliotispira prima]|uniref:V-type ATP synthase subunit I n=1 Tax=Candidatus Haliotispira prima TaxID=3034016 RepID=A0ABY8MHN6_9SPIO|nr:hypothetical protein P0082_11395 [Candidatus Haliotispira prima]